MSESIIREKAKEFAKNIVFLTKEIKINKKESVLSNQLLRSGTSIGANIHEAQYAQGTADFISKLEIALKECFESEYWLELLFKTSYIEEKHCPRIRPKKRNRIFAASIYLLYGVAEGGGTRSFRLAVRRL